MSDNHLEHIGIRGMRWGRRKGPRAPSSKDHIYTQSLRKKKAHELSNFELTNLNKRAKLVSEYKSVNPGVVDVGKKAVGGLIKHVGGIVLSGAVSAVVAVMAKQLITKYSPVKV